MTKLRIYDQVSAKRVDYFIAGSQNARKRIKKIYQVDAKVVYPFVDMNRFKNMETFDGGYYVIVGRPNKYKRHDLAIAVCKKVGLELKIISGELSDYMVARILAGCKALIIVAEEDFGLASLEAQALGKPVIAYGYGGALETVVDYKTGIFFKDQTENSLAAAMKRLDSIKINPNDCMSNAEQFSKEIFVKNIKAAVSTMVYT